MDTKQQIMYNMYNRYTCLCFLFLLCGMVCAQSPYLYAKGKSYGDVEAFDSHKKIELPGHQGIVYDGKLPRGQHTVAYEVRLPAYEEGIFFATDTLPNKWPNNTNRLLPWAFTDLKDFTSGNYRGIPSNSFPSMLGDALLLRLANGHYMFVKALAADNSMSWLKVESDGGLKLYVSTLGTDVLPRRAPLVLSQEGKSLYGALETAYGRLASSPDVSHLRLRDQKPVFEAFKYLGWCTWEHYHFDINEHKIMGDIEAIEKSELPIRYVLIDDGHLTHKGRQLSGFEPDAGRFPSGWDNIMGKRSRDKIKWFGLWYALSGYWEGVSAGNNFPAAVRNTLVDRHGRMVPGKDSLHIDRFYGHFVKSLKDYGFDFLKIDNQSFTLPIYMGDSCAVKYARLCNRSLENQTYLQNVGLINCMAQNVINTDNTYYSNVSRVSIDYQKYNKDKAKSHLFQSYTNTMLQGQCVWPDHDMFHSSDTICGALMARSKAVSGGPVYLSDAPAQFVPENIWPLIDEEGKVFRPQTPAMPTEESVFLNPLMGDKSYRVFSRMDNGALSIICYNLSTTSHSVPSFIDANDYTSLTAPAQPCPRVVAYNWKKQTAKLLNGRMEFTLEGFTDELFHLCPVNQGWAVVGIMEKFLSPQTFEILSCTEDRLELKVLTAGTLCVWSENGSNHEMRKIKIDVPKTVTMSKFPSAIHKLPLRQVHSSQEDMQQ